MLDAIDGNFAPEWTHMRINFSCPVQRAGIMVVPTTGVMATDEQAA